MASACPALSLTVLVEDHAQHSQIRRPSCEICHDCMRELTTSDSAVQMATWHCHGADLLLAGLRCKRSQWWSLHFRPHSSKLPRRDQTCLFMEHHQLFPKNQPKTSSFSKTKMPNPFRRGICQLLLRPNMAVLVNSAYC